MSEPTTRSVEFETDDGVSLSGTIFAPEAPVAVVVISGATGVPERFYRHFARWLAIARRCAVLTYIYRDMGDTSPRAMRATGVRMSDWALNDGQAARDAARSEFPHVPLFVIGHSLGGLMLSKQPRVDDIASVVTVASGLVHHKQHPMPYKLLVYFFWFLAGPATTSLLGYLPGKSIGLGARLPAGVFWQWRKWCTSPNCFLDDQSLPPSDWTRSGAPVRIVSLHDDAICPPPLARRLADVFVGAKDVTFVEIDPTDHDLGRVGHMGMFLPEAEGIWPELIGDLPARHAASRPSAVSTARIG